MRPRSPHDRPEAKESKPHHMHALSKASATHLFRAGHIDEAKHDEIVKHAEANMRKARRKR